MKKILYLLFIISLSFNVNADEKIKTNTVKNATFITNSNSQFKECNEYLNAKVGEATIKQIFDCKSKVMYSSMFDDKDININNSTTSILTNSTKNMFERILENKATQSLKNIIIFFLSVYILTALLMTKFLTKNKGEIVKVTSKPLIVISMLAFNLYAFIAAILSTFSFILMLVVAAAYNENQMLTDNGKIIDTVDTNDLIKTKLKNDVSISVNQNINRILDDNFNIMPGFYGNNDDLKLKLDNNDYYQCLNENKKYSFEKDGMSRKAFNTIKCGSLKNRILKSDKFIGTLFNDTEYTYNILNEQSNFIAKKTIERYCSENNMNFDVANQKNTICLDLESKKLYKGNYSDLEYKKDISKSYNLIYEAYLSYAENIKKVESTINKGDNEKIKEIRDNTIEYFLKNLILKNDYQFKKNEIIEKLNGFKIEKDPIFFGDVKLAMQFQKEMNYDDIKKGINSLYSKIINEKTKVSFKDKYLSDDFFITKKLLLTCKGVDDNTYCQVKNAVYKEIPQVAGIIVAPSFIKYTKNMIVLNYKKIQGVDEALLYKERNAMKSSSNFIMFMLFIVALYVAAILYSGAYFYFYQMIKLLSFILIIPISLILMLFGADNMWTTTKRVFEEFIADGAVYLISLLFTISTLSFLIAQQMTISLFTVKVSSSLSTILLTNIIPVFCIFAFGLSFPFILMHYQKFIKSKLPFASEQYNSSEALNHVNKILKR